MCACVYEMFNIAIKYNFKINSQSYNSRQELTKIYPFFMLYISFIRRTPLASQEDI